MDRPQIPPPARRSLHHLRPLWHRAGHALLRGQRLGEGGRPGGHRMAHPHGLPLHHRRTPLRRQNSGEVLPWKARYLGKELHTGEKEGTAGLSIEHLS